MAAKRLLQEAFHEIDNTAGWLTGDLHSAALMARGDVERLISQLHNMALMAGVPAAEMEDSKR